MSVRTDVINLNVNVNGNAAQNALNELRKKAADIKYEMEGLKKGTQEYVDKASELRQVTEEMSSLKKEIGITALTQKELTQELTRLKSLKGSVEPFSAEYKTLAASIKQVEDRLYSVKTGLQGFSIFFSKIKDEVKQFGILAAGYLGFEFLTSQATSIIKGAGKISDSLAQLKIYLHGTTEDAQGLYEQLKKLDTRTSNGDLLDIATIVAKKGVAKEEIVGVTKALDQLFVTLGKEVGDPHEAVASLVKLVNVYSEDKHVTANNIGNIGAAIQKLTSSGVATGEFLINFAERLAGVRGITGITIQSVLGLGSALQELGQRNESAATAAQKLVVQMFLKPELYAKSAGLSIKEFSAMLAKDPVEALIKVAQVLKQTASAPQELLEEFKGMEITGARVFGVLGDIAGNADYMRKRLKDATAAFGDQASVVAAFNEKNQTLGATLDKLGKDVNNFIYGSGLLSFLKDAALGVINFLKWLKDLPTWLEENRTALIAVTTIILAYIAAKTSATQAAILNKIATLLETAADKLEAVQKAVNIALTRAYALAKAVLTGQITLAIAAQRIWNFVMAQNPLMLVIALVGALATAISFLTSKVKEIAVAQRLANEIAKQVSDATVGEISKIKALTTVINDQNVSYDNKKLALQKLIALNPDYLAGLTLENMKTAEGKKLIDDYILSLQQKAEMEAKSALLTEKLKQRGDNLLKIRENDSHLAGLTDEQITAKIQKAPSEISTGRSWGSVNNQIGGINVADLKTNLQEVKILEDDVAASTKKTIEATGKAAKDGADKVVGTTIEMLRKQIQDLDEAFGGIDIKNKSALQKNRADRKKLQDELDALEGKEPKKKGQKLQDEAKAFAEELKKLRAEAEAGTLSENQKEIALVEEKYRELIRRAKKFWVENSTIGKAKLKEISDIRDLQINALIKKQFTADATKEYEESLANNKEYFDDLKEQATKSYIQQGGDKKVFDQKLKELDLQEKQNLIVIAQDYSTTVKKAATDVTKFKKDATKAQTADELTESENRKKIAEEEIIAKAKLAVLTAPKGSDRRLQAQKDLLQAQFELDTKYMEKKSEMYLLKEKELQLALEDVDKQANVAKIDAVMKYVQYFQNALTQLNQLITNKENKMLADEKHRNDLKKLDLKSSFDHKLMSQAQYDKKVKAIEDAQALREKEIHQKQAKREKAMGIFTTLINTAGAIVKALVDPGGFEGIAMSIAAGITGGLQIAAIEAQPLPEAGDGEWFRKGNKHTQGGIDVNIERDEAVMKAAAMTDNQAYTVSGTPAQITSRLNAMHGGADWAAGGKVIPWRSQRPASINPSMPRIMEQGGVVRNLNGQSGSNSSDALLQQLIEEHQSTREEIKNFNTKLHAVVSIKEYRREEKKYDQAQMLSGIKQAK